jgi:hypothetical protein
VLSQPRKATRQGLRHHYHGLVLAELQLLPCYLLDPLVWIDNHNLRFGPAVCGNRAIERLVHKGEAGKNDLPHARSTPPTVRASASMAARASRSMMPMHRQTYTLSSRSSGEHVGQVPHQRGNLLRGCSLAHHTL